MPVEAITTKALATANQEELAMYLSHCRSMGNEWVKRQVLQYNRIDILATYVLGLKIQPFHLALLRWQFSHPDNLQLVFRGAGKSTTCTITKSIHLLLKNPDLRILIASKTSQNAEGFLTEIKNHFENNVKLAEIFGKYYDQRKCTKWDSREIIVLPRKSMNKESSITCVGVEGTIVSKHYDVIISDDLVDEENSRTQYMRDKTRTWYYQTLLPTLEPPDKEIEHRGEHHRQGTRYHYADLYGHLTENELKLHTQRIQALDSLGRSPWPEKYPPEWLLKRKKESGILIFNCHSSDTEFLTSTGWKRSVDVSDSDMLMTLNLERTRYEYQHFSNRISENYIGEMIHFKNRSVDALVTPNHRMVAKKMGGRHDGDEWDFVEAQDIKSLTSSYTSGTKFPDFGEWQSTDVATFKIPAGKPKRRSHIDHLAKIVSGDDMSEFLGYFVSEGSTNSQVRGSISFSQNVGATCDKIEAVVRRMGFTPKVYGYDRDQKRDDANPYSKIITFQHIGFWGWLRQNCGTISGNKRVPRTFLNASVRQLEIIFKAAMLGDGSPSKTDGYYYTTVSKQLNDDLSEISLKLGRRWTYKVVTSKTKNCQDSYDAYVHYSNGTKGLRPVNQAKRVSYQGKVVCFTVPNGTLVTRRNGRTLISGNCQYQNDTEAMKGEIFQYDHCQQLGPEDWPKLETLRVYMGVDLAISEKESADKFAIAVIGALPDGSGYFVLDFYEGQLRFKAQTEKIIDYYKKWDPIKIAIETNQYQEAQSQNLQDTLPGIRLKQVKQEKDKITRAMKLSALFEDRKVFFRRGQHDLLIEHLVLFPNHRYKDLFDAVDLAITQAKAKQKRRSSRTEPGVI